MACEMTTRSGAPCSRAAIYAVESLIDGQLTRRCCCAQHRPAAIQKITYDDPSHFGHGERWNTRSGDINMHLVVERIATSVVDHVHVGSVAFGPITEIENLNREYDEYFEEYSLIGAFNLRDKEDPRYPEWVSKYELCKFRMAEIEHQIQVLELYAQVC